jgi:segregation and condensation protein A
MAYSVNLETFQGPLDLLLHLIDKSEVDIYDISIAEITEQYLQYLHNMQSLELDIASEFILMAATLVSIKSRKLLPKPIELVSYDDMEYEENDPQAELMYRLIEYKKYKKMTDILKERENLRGLFLAKPPSPLDQFMCNESDVLVEKISVYDLVKGYIKVIQRKSKTDPIATIQKDEVSVEEKIEYIRTCISSNSSINFSELIRSNSISEIVSTLLAVLELMKNREITCIQDNLFEDFIVIPVIH